MTDSKSLKSIDLASTTIMGTSINLIWSVIFTILVIIALSSIFGNFVLSFAIVGIGIIFATLVFSISECFGISHLYNFFIKKMKNVNLNIQDSDSITGISTISLGLIVGVISLVISIIIYPLIFLLLSFAPIVFGLLQALSLQGFSWIVFPASFVITPFFIIYAFIFAFILTTIGAFIFNKISPLIGGLKVSLTSEGNLTKVDSIDPKSAGIVTSIICLVFGLLYGLLFSFVSGNLPANLILIVELTIGGLIGGFIYGALSSVLYNFFAKKFNPVKIELEDSE